VTRLPASWQAVVGALVLIVVAAGIVLALGRFEEKGIVRGHVVQYQCMGSVPCYPLPAKGQEITFTAQSSGRIFATQSDANGAYSLELPTGDYAIDIPTAPWGGAPNFKGLTRIFRGTRSVTVSPSAQIVIDLEILPNQN
jgi:hypothetical protein